MYDLISDPEEKNDISSLKPQVLNSLKKELEIYWKDLADKTKYGSEDAELDDVTIQRLKSLGYIE